MAILGHLLGRLDLPAPEHKLDERLWPAGEGLRPCPNPTCISRTERRHVTSVFRLASRHPVRAFCGYCSHQFEVAMIGCRTTGFYHEPSSPAVQQIRPDHLVLFQNEAQAQAQGFRPAARVGSVR